MSNQNFEENFSSFLKHWGDQFESVKSILTYLNSYPEVLSTMEISNIQDSSSIVAEQED